VTIIPQCFQCRHLDRGSVALTCRAFPSGIPGAILLGDADHREPWPGDHGIRFEPVEDDRPGPTTVAIVNTTHDLTLIPLSDTAIGGSRRGPAASGPRCSTERVPNSTTDHEDAFCAERRTRT
jgi:hypothetical protein